MLKHLRNMAVDDGVLQRVAYSPNGRSIAVCGDRLVQVFALDGGERLAHCRGHGSTVTCVAWSPDGKLLASGSKDRTIRLWSAENGELVREVKDGFAVYGGRITSMLTDLHFYPDGKTLASSEGGSFVRLWDVATGEWRHRIVIRHLSICGSIDVSPDGKWFAVVGAPNTREIIANGSVYTIDFGLRRRLDIRHDDRTTAWHVSFSRSGESAVTSGEDGSARIWSTREEKPLGAFRDPKGEQIVASLFTTNESKVVSMNANETLFVWDAARAEQQSQIEGGDRGARGLAISPNGKQLATCGEDRVIKLWQLDV